MTRRDLERLFVFLLRGVLPRASSGRADLAGVRDAGGSMLSSHGLASSLSFVRSPSPCHGSTDRAQAASIIPSKDARQYREAVAAQISAVQDYHQLFEAPGVARCHGGAGACPPGVFNSLIQWVEPGKARDVLEASSLADQHGMRKHRVPCSHLQKSRCRRGGGNSVESYCCGTRA